MWQVILEPPVNYILAAIAAELAIYFLYRGGRFFWRGLRNPDDPDQSMLVVRGFRGGIVSIGLWFLVGGFLSGAKWPFIFAAVFLGEELFETGIMLLALRFSRSRKVQ